MPSTRRKNSLLAMGKNLAQLPDRDEAGDARRAVLEPSTKRARSLSGDSSREEPKLRRTMSVGREGTSTSLIELGEVCERERERIQESKLQSYAMKPPTPVNFNLIYKLLQNLNQLKEQGVPKNMEVLHLFCTLKIQTRTRLMDLLKFN